MFEDLIKKKLKKLREIFGSTEHVEKELLPLQGEEIRIKNKKKKD